MPAPQIHFFHVAAPPQPEGHVVNVPVGTQVHLTWQVLGEVTGQALEVNGSRQALGSTARSSLLTADGDKAIILHASNGSGEATPFRVHVGTYQHDEVVSPAAAVPGSTSGAPSAGNLIIEFPHGEVKFPHDPGVHLAHFRYGDIWAQVSVQGTPQFDLGAAMADQDGSEAAETPAEVHLSAEEVELALSSHFELPALPASTLEHLEGELGIHCTGSFEEENAEIAVEFVVQTPQAAFRSSGGGSGEGARIEGHPTHHDDGDGAHAQTQSQGGLRMRAVLIGLHCPSAPTTSAAFSAMLPVELPYGEATLFETFSLPFGAWLDNSGARGSGGVRPSYLHGVTMEVDLELTFRFVPNWLNIGTEFVRRGGWAALRTAVQDGAETALEGVAAAIGFDGFMAGCFGGGLILTLVCAWATIAEGDDVADTVSGVQRRIDSMAWGVFKRLTKQPPPDFHHDLYGWYGYVYSEQTLETWIGDLLQGTPGLSRQAALDRIDANVRANQVVYLNGNGRNIHGVKHEVTLSAKLLTFRSYCERHQHDLVRPSLDHGYGRVWANLFGADPTRSDVPQDAINLWIQYCGDDWSGVSLNTSPSHGLGTRPTFAA